MRFQPTQLSYSLLIEPGFCSKQPEYYYSPVCAFPNHTPPPFSITNLPNPSRVYLSEPVFRNEIYQIPVQRKFAINCNHFPSVLRLATAQSRGSPIYIFGQIERYLRNYVKIVFHIFRQIERRAHKCIEVRLIEGEDV